MDSLGHFNPSKNFELNIYPLPVNASSFTVKDLFFKSGVTTVLIFKLYFFAKSKSLWSCAGHPKTAPKP